MKTLLAAVRLTGTAKNAIHIGPCAGIADDRERLS